MISFLILPMQRVTRLPLLLDVSKSQGGIAWHLSRGDGVIARLWLAEPGTASCLDFHPSGSRGWDA